MEFTTVDKIVLTSSANVKCTMKVMGLLQKIGERRKNKREILIIDETGSLVLKEWGEKFNEHITENEVYGFEIKSSCHLNEVYGSLINVIPAESHRRDELLQWYSSFSEFQNLSSTCRLSNIEFGKSRIQVCRGIIIHFMKPTEPSRPHIAIIADDTAKRQLILWKLPENFDTECTGKIIIIQNCRLQLERDNTVSLIVDELSSIMLQTDVNAEQWYKEEKYKAIGNVSKKEDFKNTNIPMSSGSQRSVNNANAIGGVKKIDSTKDDKLLFETLEASYKKVSDANKSNLKVKLLNEIENTTIQNSDQVTSSLFNYLFTIYNASNIAKEKRSLKRKLFNIIQDELDMEEDENNTEDDSTQDSSHDSSQDSSLF